MGKIYGAFRAEPVKKGTPKSNMKKHCEATKEYAENQRAMEMKAYGYSCIEPENVKFNRVLVDCEKSYDEIIKECNREKFGGRTMRHDGVPMIDTIFYYSPEKTKNLLCYLHRNNGAWKKEHAEWWEAYKSLPKEARQEKVKEEYKWVESWAKASEEWAEKNLGEVAHCVLHCHEGTPHLDCKTLAIKEKENEKGERKWIWAKREILGNPAHLRKMQSKYYEECGSRFGLERGEIHEKGALREHAEKERHMAEQARKHDEDHKEQLQNEVLNLQGEINDKQAELLKLKDEISKASGDLQSAMEHILKQLEALTPKQREKEKDIISWLEKKGKIMGKGSLGEIKEATREIRKESARLDADYFDISDDDDFER